MDMKGAEEKMPSYHQLSEALEVLAWLHEHTEDGARRDEISHVRNLLWERLER